jgi:hypothetical protein
MFAAFAELQKSTNTTNFRQASAFFFAKPIYLMKIYERMSQILQNAASHINVIYTLN